MKEDRIDVPRIAWAVIERGRCGGSGSVGEAAGGGEKQLGAGGGRPRPGPLGTSRLT